VAGNAKVYKKLLHGKPVHFDAKKQTEKQREVPSEWVAEALREGRRVELKDAILTGPLDLQSAHVEQEFILLGGEVRGPVNAFYARFARWVLFGAVRFQDSVNFKGTRFAAELNCTGTHFLNGVNFQVSIIEGSFVSPGAEFGSSDEHIADFSGCKILRAANFKLTIFHGPAQFISLIVGGQASFGGVRFRQGATFDGAEISSRFLFAPEGEQRTEFGGDARFSGVKVGGQANFGMVQFKQEVSFQSATVEGEASFVGAEFQEAVSFQRAEFKAGLYFSQAQSSPATFGGAARFHGIKVGGQADFSGARFEHGAVFDRAEIGGGFFFRPEGDQRVEFGGEARFHGMKVGGQTVFSGARFEQRAAFDGAEFGGGFFFRPERAHRVEFGGEARFHGVKVGGQADFREAQFEQRAFFDGAVFGGGSFFREAEFSAPASFVNARFQLAAEFQGAHFQGPADFDYARFEQEVHFARAKFHDGLKLRDARMTTLSFQQGGKTAHFDKKSKVDLLGCTYDRLEIDGWRKLMERQSEFNPRPWSHLEKTLRAAGQDRQADDVYLERCRLERTRLFFRRQFSHWCGDWVYKLVFNYGVRPWRLVLVPPLLLLLLGTFTFSRPGAVRARSVTQSNEQTFTGTRINEPAQLIETPALSSEDAFRLSIRLFLPIGVPLATRWEASDNQFALFRFSDFAAALQLAAWVLGALYAAAFKGWLRSSAP
jgi:uncharacterized protein YjbI with pentapeptide repeats